MNRRKFLELLGKGAALLVAIPLVGIPESKKEVFNLERLGRAIVDGMADGIKPSSEPPREMSWRKWRNSRLEVVWNDAGEEWKRPFGGEWEKVRDGWPN